MSYLVLARKWRPKVFADTVGQEHVLRALTNALDSERLHHAYLFAGTRGVGKTTIARILAKALNCETGITSTPCGECTACREIDEGRFVDLIEVDAASKTKVDDTRELLENVPYAPARGRFKVYLIDEVHMLSKSSFNALLKTLEEPPPHVKFLLATTDPQKLPVTVLSRCLQFNLKRLTPALIRDRLELICEAESVDAEAGALVLIARAADGSLRDALSLLDQAIAYGGGRVAEAAVGEMLGTIDRQHVARIIGLLAKGDAKALIATIAEVDEQFPDYGRLLEDLARDLQRIAVYQVVGAADVDDGSDEADIAAFAEQLPDEDVQLFYQIALIGRRDLHLAPDPKSAVEMTLLRMLAFQPGTRGEKKSARPTATPQTEHKAARAAASPVPATVDWENPDWAALTRALPVTGAARTLARNCSYVRREKNVLHLILDRRSETFLTESTEAALSDALARHFGERFKLRIATGETQSETPLQEENRKIGEQYDALREEIESDPTVMALKDMFGAELNADSIEPVGNEPMTGRSN